ncbi:ubiquitin-conjugating enzyme/RWD-like protein [Mycena pura]|uniref:E2 ubiquitin-conjugating enzyme n=1 Tax=Mycena pura TaxID=153505 RepID=A0AAD6VSE5_9AGAR|nr:ubiquitin-conjugating enzyme/RWD-like protein [Mycena pura]
MAPLPATLKRIHREILDVQKEDLGSITLTPSDNLFVWSGTLPGPEGSVYDGGVFNFTINLPPDYPFSAPKVTFKTRIYHMNISDQGNICLDILKHNWSPALSLFKVILSLSSLLTDPNPNDPLVPNIAMQYKRNRKLYDSTARQWTELYARPKPTPQPSRVPAVKSKVRSTNEATVADSGPSSRGSPIVIDDSDDESSSRSAGKKRKRDAAPTQIDLADDDDTVEVLDAFHGNKRRAVAGKRVRPTAGSSSTQTLPLQGDIIDLD